MINKRKRSFTLIELLVVIGILAILATIVVLVINPAERLAQTRDSKRLHDLKILQSAINLTVTFKALAGRNFDSSGPFFGPEECAPNPGPPPTQSVFVSVPS